ncbi:MAG: hypothetical protein U0T73_09600 [Chitinophagales bacterium]
MKEPQSFSTLLCEVAASLSNLEKQRLSAFLESQYFNSVKALPALFQFTLAHLNGENDGTVKSAMQALRLKSGNEKKFRNAVSALLSAIQEFLYFENVRQEKPFYQEYCFYQYRDRNLAVPLNDITRQLAHNFNQTDQYSPAHELARAQALELLETSADISHKKFVKRPYAADFSRPSSLETYYVIQKLRQIVNALNEQWIYNQQRDIFNEKEVLKLAANPAIKANPLVKAYTLLCDLLRHRSDKAFDDFVEFFNRSNKKFTREMNVELHTFATNICIAKINSGDASYQLKLFDLYADALRQGVLLDRNRLDPRHFKNIVAVALRNGKTDWTDYFIHNYKKYLPAAERENAVNYNTAQFLFFKQDYSKALKHLQTVTLSDTFYGLDARALMLKCFYETDEKEAFLNAYYSFRQYVNRKKNVSSQHRRNYSNFLRFAKLLINLRSSDKARCARISSNLKATAHMADKRWLLEKMAAFE